MSLIALIATSVSAYAVSNRSRVSGETSRTAAITSMPVIPGIRWSDTTRATRRSCSASRERWVSASAPEVARTTL